LVKKCLLVISFFAIGCFSGLQGQYKITSQSIVAKDGSTITAEEVEMIHALVPFFTVITNKDIKKMKDMYSSKWNSSDEQVAVEIASVKSYCG
jgi:hypothetical protein